jgi:hypothetical protein
VRDQGNDTPGASGAGRTGGALERAACTQQIIDDKCSGIFYLADQKGAADNITAAMFVDEALAHWLTASSFKSLAEQFGPFDAAWIRRDHA